MHYPPITPPAGIPSIAAEMTGRQAKQYFAWFRGIIPDRLKILEAEVRRADGYSAWRADFTPASLQPLAAWFAAHVATEAVIPKPVILRGRQVASFDYKLSGATYTRSFDCGIYLGETLIRTTPDSTWIVHPARSKRNPDFGHPVVRGRTGNCCNTVMLMVTFAHNVVGKMYGPERVSQLFEHCVQLFNFEEAPWNP